MVGLALRRQDANATRNIPQVVRTTEAVIVSIWKRALVNKLNTMALIVETLHVANAFLFINVLPIHVFVPSDASCFCARRLTARQEFISAYRTTLLVSLVTLAVHVCRCLSTNFSTLAAGSGVLFYN